MKTDHRLESILYVAPAVISCERCNASFIYKDHVLSSIDACKCPECGFLMSKSLIRYKYGGGNVNNSIAVFP